MERGAYLDLSSRGLHWESGTHLGAGGRERKGAVGKQKASSCKTESTASKQGGKAQRQSREANGRRRWAA